jgi:hypothetical protein
MKTLFLFIILLLLFIFFTTYSETYRNYVIPNDMIEEEPVKQYSTIKYMGNDFYRLNRIYY